jgi:sulfate transport system permease protein
MTASAASLTSHPASAPQRSRILPGFGLALGCSLFYLSVMVLLPFAALIAKAGSLGLAGFWASATGPRAVASYRITIEGALTAATINAVFGLLVAWVLVRRPLPGQRLIDALIDLPFILPAAVGGIALTAIFGPHGWIGQWCFRLGIPTAYSSIGVMIAMLFIGLPYVVRSIQPVLSELDPDVEEAAACLGARPWQIVTRIILPAILPATLTGFTLAFARGLGEYGAVIFISGNIPLKTEVSAQVISIKLDQFDYGGASAVAVMMLLASFLLLLAINVIQARVGGSRR